MTYAALASACHAIDIPDMNQTFVQACRPGNKGRKACRKVKGCATIKCIGINMSSASLTTSEDRMRHTLSHQIFSSAITACHAPVRLLSLCQKPASVSLPLLPAYTATRTSCNWGHHNSACADGLGVLLQGQDASETPTGAPLVVEGHGLTSEINPEASAAPAADPEADAEEDEPPAPTGGLELAEAAERLLAELDAYSKWKSSVRIHKLPAETSSQADQPAANLSPAPVQARSHS